MKRAIEILAKNKKLTLLFIIVLALSVRLYFTFSCGRKIEYDQQGYDNLALSLLNEHQFLRVGKPTAYITPLYPLFLSFIYFIFGHSYLWVRIIQALLGGSLCLIIYRIAREVLDESAALLAAFLTGIHYFFIAYGILILSENLFTFLVALNVLFLVKFCKRPSFLFAAMFGLFSSLATLTRSAHFLFIFMVMAFLLLVPGLVNIARRSLIRFFTVAVLVFCIPMSVWTIRNYVVFKRFIPLGTEAGIVIYSSYHPPKGKLFDKIALDDISTGKCAVESEVEYSRCLLKETINSIRENPDKIYKYIPVKLMYFFSIFDWVAFTNTGAYNFFSAFILPLAFLGIALLIKKKLPNEIFILLLPVIYYLLVTIGIMGVPRTRLPVEPFLVIFAAGFMHYVYGHYRAKSLIVYIFIAWYFFNYYLYINPIQSKAAFRQFFQSLGLW